MTDFLSRLAARTVHATPVVEPRRPSRHEPIARDDQSTRFDAEVGWADLHARGDEIERVPGGTSDRASRGVSDVSPGDEADRIDGPIRAPAGRPRTSAPRIRSQRVAARPAIDGPIMAVEAPALTKQVRSAWELDDVRVVGQDERWPEHSMAEPEHSMAELAVRGTGAGLAPKAHAAPVPPTDVALRSPSARQPPERDAVDIGSDDSTMEHWPEDAIPSRGPRPFGRVPARPGPPTVAEPEIVATSVDIDGRRRTADSPSLPEVGLVSLSDHKGTVPDVASEPAGPPVVHVTIGRIEVKAVPPAPAVVEPVRPPETVAPTLSLDDYLERRKVGWG